ncbi:MAG: GGDEF domain-containing protein [Actinobacteria bacterium]|nr:GGDEF domain-containing protein [Actinomycetota bacterium]
MTGRFVCQQRPPLLALEHALRGLRWSATVLVVAWLIDSAASPQADLAVVAVAPAALVLANVSSLVSAHRPDADPRLVGRLIRAQICLDVVAVVVSILGMRPEPSSPLWAALAFPVLEGAVRFQFSGAVLTWAALALALFSDRIARWAPRAGYEPLIELAAHLGTAFALGVVAGYLAEKLVAEMYLVAAQRASAEGRARLLAVLAVAGERLSGGDAHRLASVGLEAVMELGFDAAELVVFSGDRGCGEVVSHLGAAPAPLREPDLVELASACAALTPRSVVRHGSTRQVGVLGHRLDKTMVITACADTPAADRDEAFAAVAGSLATALATAARERAVRANERRLRHEATHDPLTGRLNRAGLMGVARSVSVQPDARTRLVAFVDLDGFKAVNDTHGHDVGDGLLNAVGQRLSRVVPDGAVGRLGGDEFVVLSGANPPLDAPGFSALIGGVFDAPVPTPAGLIDVAGSIGVCDFDPTLDPGAQWSRADEAMYLDKAARRLGRAAPPDRGAASPKRDRSPAQDPSLNP